ncbi:MAG: Gfo/Idh/MocA family oxidoreductase [Chthoniobacterales bacterium]
MSTTPNSPPTHIGIIGCGNIFGAYARGCRLFNNLHLKACADLNPDFAAKRAEEFEITALSIDELLADPDIEIVVNLTIPKVHAQVSTAIIKAGKHAYSEKPISLDLPEGEELLALAAKHDLRIGSAPDTFLGAGAQTTRKLIDDGLIGTPIGGTAFMLYAGPERWHPNPAFFYQRGAGPMFDMGPYYIAALVNLIGPVKTVCAMTTMPRTERVATCAEQYGAKIPVEVPTHYSGSLLFESGAVINLAMSFDVIGHRHAPIEIYGTEGSLSVPDPNTFEGPVSLLSEPNADWQEMPLTYGYSENSRSIGVADLAAAIVEGREHRCNGRLALHTLEVMAAFEKSHETRAWVDIVNQCEKPAALPLGLAPGTI